jgi:hypothetical protein
MSDNKVDIDEDRPLYGAEAIGRAAGFIDEDGNVKIRSVYHALESRLLDADKFGKIWVSTRRRARSHATGGKAS